MLASEENGGWIIQCRSPFFPEIGGVGFQSWRYRVQVFPALCDLDHTLTLALSILWKRPLPSEMCGLHC